MYNLKLWISSPQNLLVITFLRGHANVLIKVNVGE